MRVLLTSAQISKIQSVTQPTDARIHFDRWLDADHVEGQSTPGTKRYSVLMPPDAWLWVRDLLVEYTIRADGRRAYTEGRTSSWHTLTRKIVEAVNRRQRHPALFGSALPGSHIEWVPAWHREGEDLLPFVTQTVPPEDFVCLVPTTRRWGKVNFTSWAPGVPMYDLALMEESEHLLFRRQVHGVARNPDGGAESVVG